MPSPLKSAATTPVSGSGSCNSGRFLGKGSVAFADKEKDVLLCLVGEGYVQKSVVIEVPNRDTRYVARRVESRGFEMNHRHCQG